MTRLQLNGGWDDWPEDMGSVTYLITLALEMDLGVATDKGGLLPQKWRDVIAFGEHVGGLTEGWEFNTLMDMSKSYVNEFMNGRDMLRASPMDRWRREHDDS